MHDPRLINDGGGAQIRIVFWRVKPVGFGEVDGGQYDAPRACSSCGGAMMVRSDVFQQWNGFDPVFGPSGPKDVSFSLRLQKADYNVMCIPKAVGYHEVSHTFGRDIAKNMQSQIASLAAVHATPSQYLAKKGFLPFRRSYSGHQGVGPGCKKRKSASNSGIGRRYLTAKEVG